MNFTERKTVYFHSSEPQNTGTVLKLAKEYARAEGIKDIVVASTTGEMALKLQKFPRVSIWWRFLIR